VTQEWSKDVIVLFYGPSCPYSKYVRYPNEHDGVFLWGQQQVVVMVREFLDVEMPKLLDMVSHVSSLIVAKIDCSGTLSRMFSEKIKGQHHCP
jgi:hypothetical protein